MEVKKGQKVLSLYKRFGIMLSHYILLFAFFINCAGLLLPSTSSFAQTDNSNQVIPYTLADRDRAISVEIEIKSLRNEMMTKFDSQQRQIDDLKNLFYWGFGILISIMLFLLGYNIWDRRTAIDPLKERTYSMSEKYSTLIQVLKEFAKEQPKLSEVLKMHGIL